MLPAALAARLADGRRIPFSDYVELALYDPVDGFYGRGGQAGRRADFLTSPEVGPLFGALLARWLDATWEQLDRPDPFVVVDAGAGPGTLARAIRVAEPRCAASAVYVLVERSPAQRRLHSEHLRGWVGERSVAGVERLTQVPLAGAGPVFVSSPELPGRWVGAVIANELLDNLPFDIVRRRGLAAEQMLVAAVGDDLTPVPDPAAPDVAHRLADLGVPDGVWVPWQESARRWVADIRGRVEAGRVLVVDYAAPTAELAERPELGWMRTFRGQERGGHPLDEPGSQDITSDVALDQVQFGQAADRVRLQVELLDDLGLDELVDEGRRHWDAHAHAPDVVALRARSRVREAEALVDPAGLGAFVALEWDLAGN